MKYLQGGDGIVQTGVRASEWLGGNMNGACFAVGLGAWEGSFQGWGDEVGGGCCQKIVVKAQGKCVIYIVTVLSDWESMTKTSFPHGIFQHILPQSDSEAGSQQNV